MGCSNTTSKKERNIKVDKIKKQQGKEQEDKLTNDEKSKNQSNGRDSTGKTIKEITDSVVYENNSIPKGCINIKVECDTVEKMYPVWVDKGNKVKIYIRGSWSLFPEYGMVNYKGHTNINSKHRDCHIGALIGRVQGEKYFPVKDGMVYISNTSGPIYFFANNSNFSVKPNGSLELFISNVKLKNYDEIESNLGWNIKELRTIDGIDYLTPEEKLQFIYINKVRSNPKLFANQYLFHLISEGPSYKEIYEKLLNYPSCKLVKPNQALYKTAYSHASDMGENGSTGHLSTNGEDVKTRLLKYSQNPVYFGENCCYGTKDPLSIVIKLLVDDGIQSRVNRANILNETYNQLGLSVHPHITYTWNCVQVFGSNITQKN